MNIVIIEDELKTAQLLEKIILGLQPGTIITGRYQSVESSVKALSQEAQPDLIFMDVQLADGLCWQIFKAVRVTCPVIFCTAYDEFSLEAFKSNGIDYILKPFSKEDIRDAFKKVDELRNFFQQKIIPDLGALISKLSAPAPAPAGKESFLIFKSQKYTTVPTESIAYFSIRFQSTWMMTFDKKEYAIDLSLDQVAAAVSSKQFFRVSRQYLVNFKAIREVEHYFLRKLYVKLVMETPDKLLINKERSHSFLSWMEER